MRWRRIKAIRYYIFHGPQHHIDESFTSTLSARWTIRFLWLSFGKQVPGGEHIRILLRRCRFASHATASTSMSLKNCSHRKNGSTIMKVSHFKFVQIHRVHTLTSLSVRCTTLFTFLWLRSLLGKDLALLIAQLVYATRPRGSKIVMVPRFFRREEIITFSFTLRLARLSGCPMSQGSRPRWLLFFGPRKICTQFFCTDDVRGNEK